MGYRLLDQDRGFNPFDGMTWHAKKFSEKIKI